jgi:hypothetical protein
VSSGIGPFSSSVSKQQRLKAVNIVQHSESKHMSNITSAPLEGSNYLIDIAARIKIEHQAVAASLRQSVHHAIAAGELLLQAKKQVAHGKWLSWLGEHCSELSERSAQAYMKLARNKTEIPNPQLTADLTIDAALKSLSKPKGIPWQKRINSHLNYEASLKGLTVTELLEGREPKPRAVPKPLPNNKAEALASDEYKATVERGLRNIANGVQPCDSETWHLAEESKDEPAHIPFHPASDELSPLMKPGQISGLADDIKQYGMLLPITLYEGKILDGRCRYLACLEAGVEPTFKNFPDDYPHYSGSHIDFILSANLMRQHLSEDQRAVILVQLFENEEEAA